MTKNHSLRQILNAGPTNVRFTKVDGTVRNMLATTRSDLFTYEAKGSNTPEKAGTIRVWDLEKKAFRTIIENQVINFTA